MAAKFNLTAQINLRAPSNLKPIVSNIRKQLGDVQVNINPTINQSTIKNIASNIRTRLANIKIPITVTASSSSIKSLSQNIGSRLSNINASVNVRVNGRSISAARRTIQSRLGTINASVNVNVSATAVRNASGLNANLTQLNNTLNAITTSSASAAASINALTAALRGASSSPLPRNINVGIAGVGASSAATSQIINQMGSEIENFGRQGALAIRRFAAFSAVTTVIFGITRAIQQGVSAFIDFDKELTKIQAVTGETKAGLSSLASSITTLSTGLGVSSKDLTGVSLTLAQAGFSAGDTAKALKALALTDLAPTFDNLSQTVEGSIALLRQFNINAGDLEKALGSINKVAAKFAVESSDIIAAIQRTGGVFATASKGVSEGTDALNEFIAIFTSVRATTRESAETIATGLRTIFTRIQRGSTIEALKEFGVTLTDAEGKFVGAYKAIELLSRGLNTIDPRDLKFSQIVEELGGFRQIGKVIPLIQQLATTQEALKVAQQGQDSLAEDAVIAQASLANQIAKTREQFLALFRDIGTTDTFQTIAKGALGLANALISVADSLKSILPILAVLATSKAVTSIVQFSSGFVRGLRTTTRSGGGPILGFNEGGIVPGSGKGDKVPAMLEPGEVVMSNKAVSRYGRGNLVRMNQYARGGPVKASQLKSATIKNRVKSANSDVDPEEFRSGNYITDSDLIYFDKTEYGVKASKNISYAKFEDRVGEKIGGKPLYGNSPIDIPKNKLGIPIEVRNRKETTKNPELLDKLLRYNLETTGSLVSNQKQKDNNLYAGKIGVAYNTSKLQRSLFTSLNMGGEVQKFMAGKFVKPIKKQKTIFPADLLVGPAGIDRAVWPKTIRKALGKGLKFDNNDILFPRSEQYPEGQRIPLKKVLADNPGASVRDALARAGLQSGKLRKRLTKKYNLIQDGVKEESRPRTPEEVDAARKNSLLFGAAGMYGNRFPPSEIKFGKADGLKEETKATVFGSLLDKNAKEKEKRLQKRKIMLDAAGVPGGFDSGSAEIQAAPTAKFLSDTFIPKGVSKANKALAIDRVGAIAKTLSPQTQGSQIFLDFDRTLAFGAEKIGPKINKKKPDYSAFGVTSEVAAGLKNAKLSNLGTKLISIVRGLDNQSPGLGRELLRKMFVVSARPQKTMPLIARWVRNKGLRIPPRNVLGVGGAGLSPDDIAVAKAEKMLSIAGPGSVFIDDDAKNISEAREKGITSTQYGTSSTKKSRRQDAQQEGLQFEQYIDEQLPKGLKTGVLGPDKEGMDFPFGLGNSISQYWFKDSRLSNIPVDTKRTLTGPGGKIKKNILSYLKQQGYNSGGMVQKFMAGQFVMPKARGSSGPRQSYKKRKFQILSDQQYDLFSKEEYQKAGKYGSSGWDMTFKPPMPKTLAKYWKDAFSSDRMGFDITTPKPFDSRVPVEIQKKLAQVYGTGVDSNWPKGAPGSLVKGFLPLEKQREQIVREPKRRVMDARTLRGMTAAAGGIDREALKGVPLEALKKYSEQLPRAPKDILEARIAAAPGKSSLTSGKPGGSGANFLDVKPRFIQWGKKPSEGDFSQVVAGLENQIRKQLSGNSATHFEQLLAAKSLDKYKALGGKDGHIPPLKKAIYRILGITEKSLGGFIQSFAAGGRTESGLSVSRASQAILGKQLSGAEMQRAARKAGYDIEELDNLKIKLSHRGKTMHDNLTREEASSLLASLATGYNIGGKVNKFAEGKMVDAMVSNGEAYVPPELAQSIGRSKLDKMNQADMNGVSGFSKGGISIFKGPGSGTSDSIRTRLPVGSYIIREKATQALGLKSGGKVGGVRNFSSGGDVQRFFFGGRARARPGSEATIDNLMVSGNVITQLREITNALQELGITSSSSADLIRRGGRISAQAASAAYEADILRMRVAGAPMQSVIEAETRLANMRQQSQTQVRAQRQLSGVAGSQLQNVESAAQANMQRMVQRAQAAGVDLDENQMGRIERTAYSRAGRQEGLSSRQTAGLTGNDLRTYINSAMGDPRTFEQMNRQFEANRRMELNRQYRTELSLGGTRTLTSREITQSLQRATRDAAEEAKIRRQALNQTRGAAGPGVSGGQKMQQGMFMASFALPMLAEMIAGNPSQATTSSGASMSAGFQGATNVVAMGGILTSMLPQMGMFGNGLAIGAVAAAALGKAFIDARNAAIEFAKADAKKKLDNVLETVSKSFEELSKDVGNVNIQQAITTKLIEAGKQAKNIINAEANNAKAFFVNFIDAFDIDQFLGFNQNKKTQDTSQRSTILERLGSFAYIESYFNKEVQKVNFNKLIPQIAAENSKLFSEVASNTNRIIEERLRSGESIEDIMGNSFEELADNIAGANAEIQEAIIRVQSSDLGGDEKKNEIKNIKARFAEGQIRKKAAILEAETRVKEAEKSANLFSRSLERIFQNMEQSIGRTSFELDRMRESLDLVASSLTGQAKAGNSVITALNILANPRAYTEAERSSAQTQASSLFVGNRNILKGLLTFGDNIEGKVLATINKTLRENPGEANNEVIAAAIERAVRQDLADLQLPPDVSSKIANQVREGLVQLRKSQDEKIDFTDLVEKIPSLSKVIDSAKRAQEVAIKSLEFWQNSLNNYTSATNQLVDLQIETNSRLRQANKLLINSQIDLAKTLGKDISVATLTRARDFDTASRTGGATDPADIFNRILQLENRRKGLQSAVDATANIGPSAVATKNFIQLDDSLTKNNVALRESYAALKELADNGELVSAALNKVQEAQQKTTARSGFLEKLVTSTPEELNNLNNAFFRLQRNLAGQTNSIQNSIGAQKAYFEALNSGSSAFEAMQAAQQFFVSERKETLDVFNQILPFLGQGQQSNDMRANVLQSMLAESGFAMTPMFQDMINAIRNPEADPETRAAIEEYKKVVAIQNQSNILLAKLNDNLAKNIADQSAQILTDALSKLKFTFETSELREIRDNVVEIRRLLSGDRPVAAVPRASGGIIYASAGQAIDFSSRGTDTVPAMLTPGEFVVNRRSTQQNLPLLQSINSGNYSSGGKVKYYNRGGYVSNIENDNTLDSLATTKEQILDIKHLKNIYPLSTYSPGNTIALLKEPYGVDGIKPDDKSVGGFLIGEAPKIMLKNKDRGFEYEGSVIPKAPLSRTPFYHAIGISSGNSLNPILQGDFLSKTTAESDDYKKALAEVRREISRDPQSSKVVDSINVRTSTKPSGPGQGGFWNPNIASGIGLLVSKTSNPTPPTPQSYTTNNQTDKIFGTNRRNWSDVGQIAAGVAGIGIGTVGTIAAGATAVGTGWTGVGALGAGVLGTTGVASIGLGVANVYSGYQGTELYPNLLSKQGSEKSTKETSLTGTYDTYPINSNDFSWLQNEESISAFKDNETINRKLFDATVKHSQNPEYRGLSQEDQGAYNEYQNVLRKLLTGSPYENLPLNYKILNQGKLEKTMDSKDISITKLYAINRKYNEELKNKINDIYSEEVPKDLKFVDSGLSITSSRADKFGLLSNYDPAELLGNIDILGKKEDFQKGQGEAFGIAQDIKTLSGTFKAGKYNVPYQMVYTDYKGKLFDKDKQELLDQQINFSLLGAGQAEASDIFNQESIGAGLPISYAFNSKEDIKRGIEGLNEAPILAYINAIADNKEPAREIIDNLDSLKVTPSLRLKKNKQANPILGIGDGLDIFESPSQVNRTSFSISKWVKKASQKAIENTVEEARQDVAQVGAFGADSGLAQNQLRGLLSNLLDGSVELFQNKPGLPGLGKKWLGSFNTVRSLLKSKKPLDLSNLKQYSSQASNIFGFVAGQAQNILSGLTNTRNTPQNRMSDFVQELSILTSGASSAFNILSSGRTGFLDNFIDGDNTNTSLENLFRTLGFNRVWKGIQGTKLDEGYKRSLENQLRGSRIRTVDSSGKITTKDFAETDLLSDTQSVVDIAFNPYNEFPRSNIRQNLINDVLNYVNSSVDKNGRRLFNNTTADFIKNNTTPLANRYLLQDSLFDIGATQQDKQESLLTLGAQQSPDYEHKILGFKDKFGALPDSAYFEKRLLVDPQTLSSGGTVYASNGRLINFQSKGTDTVPAMLTPGEFVVNRNATQNNLPLLQSINNGNYSSGGVVYARSGALIGQPDNITKNTIARNTLLGIQKFDNKINDIDKRTISIDKKLNKIEKINLFSSGGVVYASGGTLVPYQPRGTDTVPAMLTPGEFVVNRSSTQKNLPLLKSINSGAGGYSEGGVIYAQEGMKVPYNILEYQKSTKPPQKPAISIDKKTTGLASAEIGADDRSLAEMEKSQAEYEWKHGRLEVPNTSWFGSPTRRETDMEAMQRRMSSLHPNMSPGLDADFYPNLVMAMQILGDIGSGFAAGGGGRGSVSSIRASRRADRYIASKQPTAMREQIQYSNIDEYKQSLTSKYYDELARLIQAKEKEFLLTPDPKKQGSVKYGLKSQINLLNKDYGKALLTSNRDYETGQIYQGSLGYNVKRAQAEEVILGSFLTRFRGNLTNPGWKLGQSDDPLVDKIARLGGYDQSVLERLAAKVISLGGPTGELPATLSSRNITLGDDIGLQSIGAIAPVKGAATLDRVPVAEFSKSLFSPIDIALRVLRSGLNRPDGPNINQDMSEAYIAERNTEAQALAENLLRSTNYEQAGPLADNYYIDLATRLLELTRETQQKRLDNAFKKYSPSASSQSKKSKIVVSDTEDGSSQMDPSRSRLNLDEIIAYYEGGSDWGRVSAEPKFDLGGGQKIYGIDTALVKRGTLLPLIDALVKHISSKDSQSALSFASSSYSEEAIALIPRLIAFAQRKYAKIKLDPEGPDSIENLAFRIGTDRNPEAKAQTKNHGGLIYASKGQLIDFQPKGTDTVPAMLTPGEFVVNRSATQKNLPLLRSINSGVEGYSRGGVVYLQDGGLTPETRKSLLDLQARGYNLEDIISGKTRVVGIIVKSIQSEDPLLSYKPAPNQETYRENPKRWNGWKDESGFWWDKRGESYISAYGPPPALPNFQERFQAFEAVVSAFAGAGGVKTSRGLADVRQLPAGMPMQRTAPGPLGSRVDIPAAIGRPNPGSVATKQQIVLDSIKDSGGNFYISDVQSKALTIKPPSTDRPKIPQKGLGQLDFPPPVKPRTIDDPFGIGPKPKDPQELIAWYKTRIEKEFETKRDVLVNRNNQTDDWTRDLAIENLERIKNEKLKIPDLIAQSESYEFALPKIRRGQQGVKLKPSMLGLSENAVMPYDQLVAMVESMSPESLKTLASSASLLGTGANRSAWGLNEGLALYTDARVGDLSSLLDRNFTIQPQKKSPKTEFESQFGGTIATVVDDSNKWIASIIARASGVATSGADSIGPGLIKESKSLDLLSLIDSYDENVFIRLFQDQLRLAEGGYGIGLSDAKLQNMVFGQNRIVPVDIGASGKEPNPTFPTSSPFREQPDLDLPSVILSDRWLREMEKQLVGKGGTLNHSIEDLLDTDPKAFLDKISNFEYFPYELDPRSNSEFILGDAARTAYAQIQKRILERIRASHKRVKSDKTEPKPLSSVQEMTSRASSSETSATVDQLKDLQYSYGDIPNLLGSEERPLFSRDLPREVKPEQIEKFLASDRVELEQVARLMDPSGGVTAADAAKRLADRMLKLQLKSFQAGNRGTIFSYQDVEQAKPSRQPTWWEKLFDDKNTIAIRINSEKNREGIRRFKEDQKAGKVGGMTPPRLEDENLNLVVRRFQRQDDVIVGSSSLPNRVNPQNDVRINNDVINLARHGIYQKPFQTKDPQQQIYPTSPLDFYKQFMMGQDQPVKPVNRQSGGLIYASSGQLINFQPKGTDTVPAMLTPGEFVVNRAATQQNMPLLRSINSGSVGGYSEGGVIYAQGGGLIAEGKPLIDEFFNSAINESANANRWYVLSKDKKEIFLENSQSYPHETVNPSHLIKDKSKLASVDAIIGPEAINKSKTKYDGLNKPLKFEEKLHRVYPASKFLKDHINKYKRSKFGKADSGSIVNLIDRELSLFPNLFESNNADLFTELDVALSKNFEGYLKVPAKAEKIKNDLYDRLYWLQLIEKNNTEALTKLNEGDRDQNLSAGDRRRLPTLKQLVNTQITSSGAEANNVKNLLTNPNLIGLTPKENKFANSRFFNLDDPTIKNSYEQIVTKNAYNKGGVVYASKGQLINFQPKGTDTVPAMLTPGEFVVNRAATQKNLPLLKTINNGGAEGYNKGGVVYLQQGGLPRPNSWTPSDESVQRAIELVNRKREDAEKAKQQKERAAENVKALEELRYQDRKTVSEGKSRQQQQKEALRLSAFKEQQKSAIEISDLRDQLNREYYSNLSNIKDMTGLTSLNDIFEIFPRLHILREFAARGGSGNVLGVNLDGAAMNQPDVIDILDFINKIQIEVNKQPPSDFIDSNGPPLKNIYEAITNRDIDGYWAKKIKNNNQAENLSKGGTVYASKGTLVPYQPKGTDTVPAMLTPGEFVVNKKASQDNLSLLHSINSGNYNQGGAVYLRNGTPMNRQQMLDQRQKAYEAEMQRRREEVQAKKETYKYTQTLPVRERREYTRNQQASAAAFDASSGPQPQAQPNNIEINNLEKFTTQINLFGNYVKQLSEIKLVDRVQIHITSEPIQVVITGSAALENMSEGIQNMITSQVNKKLGEIWNQTDGQIGQSPGIAQV